MVVYKVVSWHTRFHVPCPMWLLLLPAYTHTGASGRGRQEIIVGLRRSLCAGASGVLSLQPPCITPAGAGVRCSVRAQPACTHAWVRGLVPLIWVLKGVTSVGSPTFAACVRPPAAACCATRSDAAGVGGCIATNEAAQLGSLRLECFLGLREEAVGWSALMVGWFGLLNQRWLGSSGVGAELQDALPAVWLDKTPNTCSQHWWGGRWLSCRPSEA